MKKKSRLFTSRTAILLCSLTQTALTHASQFTLTEVLDNTDGGTSLGHLVGDNTVVVDFNGTLNDGLVTDLSNISVYLNGVGFTGNGSLFASSQWDNTWQQGGAQIGFSQSNTDFLISDVNFPNGTQEVNYFYDISGEPNAYAGQLPAVYVQNEIQNDQWTYTSYNLTENTTLSVAANTAPSVPEPSAIVLWASGLIAFSMSRRKKNLVSKPGGEAAKCWV
ncbi:MAG: PEP-CTERM sorting domain-containing protein [Methylomonas sp.]|jgi:hypothetical protein